MFGNINIYTDGSRMNDSSGFGYVINDSGLWNEHREKVNNYCTVFHCKVLVRQKAGNELLQYRNKQIEFFTDSQTAIKSLFNNKIKSQTVLEAISALNTLGENNTVNLNWIKAHNGHVMND